MFHNGVLTFVHSVEGAAWPVRYPDLEAALKGWCRCSGILRKSSYHTSRSKREPSSFQRRIGHQYLFLSRRQFQICNGSLDLF